MYTRSDAASCGRSESNSACVSHSTARPISFSASSVRTKRPLVSSASGGLILEQKNRGATFPAAPCVSITGQPQAWESTPRAAPSQSDEMRALSLLRELPCAVSRKSASTGAPVFASTALRRPARRSSAPGGSRRYSSRRSPRQCERGAWRPAPGAPHPECARPQGSRMRVQGRRWARHARRKSRYDRWPPARSKRYPPAR